MGGIMTNTRKWGIEHTDFTERMPQSVNFLFDALSVFIRKIRG